MRKIAKHKILTMVEQLNMGLVSIYDEELDDTICFSSYDDYFKYLELIEKAKKQG